MNPAIKVLCLCAALLAVSCAGSGQESSDWRQNPQRLNQPVLYGDGLYSRGFYPDPEYRHWVYQELRDQRLRARGRIDNSTDSGTGMGQRVDMSSW